MLMYREKKRIEIKELPTVPIVMVRYLPEKMLPLLAVVIPGLRQRLI